MMRHAALAFLAAGLVARAAPAASPLEELTKARRDKAERVYKAMVDALNPGPPPPGQRPALADRLGEKLEAVYQWSRRWLEAETELAAKPEGRAAALKGHHDRMEALAKLARALHEAGDASQAQADAADFYRLEAAAWLEKAKGGR